MPTVLGIKLVSTNPKYEVGEYIAFETYSRKLNTTLFAVKNQIYLWDEDGELVYQEQLNENIMCAEYSE